MNTSHEQLRIEARIKEINQIALREALPEVTERELNRAISFVAAVRARYLQAVLQMTHPEKLAAPDSGSKLFDDLASLRRDYNEALAALDALRHAIDREYIDLQKI